MREFWREILHRLEDGVPVCLVSVLDASGSTPRGAGAVMAVLPDGGSTGTIGGGNVEYEAQRLARELLACGGETVRKYRFVQGEAASLGMVCGGDVTVHFQLLRPEDAPARGELRRLVELAGEGRGVWLLRRLEGGRVTALRALGGGEPICSELSPLMKEEPVSTQDGWFSIPVERPGRVYLFGAGHVSRELAALLARTGFRCVVLDDRAEFADPARFPEAERVEVCDFSRLELPVTANDYVVVMTRGHQADYEVLSQTLRSGARYIGCIGSRKKLSVCRERLLADGFTPEEYAVLHAPIGLDIGAQTPAEIAVSVAAEMIAVRAGTVAKPFRGV